MTGSWAHDRAERHRAFLAAKGYQPTAYEVEQAEAAARRHEESLARTAEFRAQEAGAEDAVAELDGAEAGEPGLDDPAEDNPHDEQEAAFDDAG